MFTKLEMYDGKPSAFVRPASGESKRYFEEKTILGFLLYSGDSRICSNNIPRDITDRIIRDNPEWKEWRREDFGNCFPDPIGFETEKGKKFNKKTEAEEDVKNNGGYFWCIFEK